MIEFFEIMIMSQDIRVKKVLFQNFMTDRDGNINSGRNSVDASGCISFSRNDAVESFDVLRCSLDIFLWGATALSIG